MCHTMLVVVMTSLERLADKHCRKVRENEGLDKCHQDLDEINEHREGDGHRRKPDTSHLAHTG